MDIKKSDDAFTADAADAAIAFLQGLADDGSRFARLTERQRLELLKAAGRISRPDREEARQRSRVAKQLKRQEIVGAERAARRTTGIRSAREAAVYAAPARIAGPDATGPRPELHSPRNCYVCKAEYTTLHFFYDAMCPSCGDFNYAKRFQTAPLEGQIALITGARVKIGYQATLMLLRAGAEVIATTRFPVDAALRYAAEADYPAWADRLWIHGLDLRHTPSVELFCRHLAERHGRLDVLINNAAQTVRRPPGFYGHLLSAEAKAPSALPAAARHLLRGHEDCLAALVGRTGPAASGDGKGISLHAALPGVGLRESARLSQVAYHYDDSVPVAEIFPDGLLDADRQQVDLRTTNSWRLRLGEIEPEEMLELQLVNAVAPFVLCNRLAPLMRRDRTDRKHIVNVTAMEGKFFRFVKDGRHPHTNMAKAALNMLTHTSAAGLARDGIFMNAVDTGWVTDEDPVILARRKQEEHDFQPPLDIVDGAARILDPLFNGILTGKHWSGAFLKDYRPIDW